MDIKETHAAVLERVVGREKESRLILAALFADRDLLLEGPPGTSKSTILRTITEVEGTSFYLVEGNADLTPAKIIGHHSPSRVMQEDYSADTFMPGPLPRAMQEGGFLYIEELNRVPEDTLNTLITAMAERELYIPRVGKVQAAEKFRIIAAMNPFDNIGTGRLSGALMDRLCRVRMTYQTGSEEEAIVAARTGSQDTWLVEFAVRVVRLTREHPDLRMGGSVRAAIDYVMITEQMAALTDLIPSQGVKNRAVQRMLIEAARTAIAIKVVVRESARREDEEIIDEIVTGLLALMAVEGASLGGAGSKASEGAPEIPGGAGANQGKAKGGRPKDHSMDFAAGRTPENSVIAGGQIYYGDEAQKSSKSRPGDRGSKKFGEDFPDLREKIISKRDVDKQDLEEAIEEGEHDPLEILAQMASFFDRSDLRDLARQLAVDLIIEDARRNVSYRTGRGKLSSMPYRADTADIDLERTVENLIGKPYPEDSDFFIWERRQRSRAYALILDISGSMKGKKIFYAAMALAAVAVRVHKEPYSVIAFWRDAAMLKQIQEPADLNQLLEKLFSLPGRGLTNLELGLRAGLDQLETATTQERVGILFSDGLQTAGPPAEPLASAFPTLHVVGTGETEESFAHCHTLASLGNGRCAIVMQEGGIAQAVNRCLAS